MKCVLSLDLRIQHCDLAHPEVHQISKAHVQMHLCAEEMHGFCQESAYFVFDLTFLLKDNRVHGFLANIGWPLLA